MPGLQDAAMMMQQQEQQVADSEGGIPQEELVAEEQATADEALDVGEELDSDIGAGLLYEFILSNETTDQIENALSAQNPVPAIAQIIATGVDKIAQKSEERGMPLSPRIWLSKSGAVDRAIDKIAEMADKLGVNFPEQAQSAAFGEVVDALKLAGQAERRGKGTPPPPEAAVGAPSAPSGAPIAPVGAMPVPQMMAPPPGEAPMPQEIVQ